VVALLSDIPAGCLSAPRPAALRPVPSEAEDKVARRPAVPIPVPPRPAISAPVGADRPSRATYLRRRMAAVGIVVLLLFLTAIAADAALARIGGGPLTTTGATSGPRTVAAQAWVVRPGDTLWGIAESIHPSGDVRPLVDRLSQEVGNAPLYPGEVIQLPAGR